MTFSDLRKKDIICTLDGRLIGRAADLAIDAGTGQIRAILVPSGTGMGCIWHGEKSVISIPWQQIACIGDDVILVSQAACCK